MIGMTSARYLKPFTLAILGNLKSLTPSNQVPGEDNNSADNL